MAKKIKATKAVKPLTVSVATIAKDEGKYIGRLIESCQPFAHEIVIGIDDTTTDNTREVCEQWAKKSKCPVIIYDYTWEKNFSKARNQGVDLCTGDWIQCLDAHEYIEKKSAETFLDSVRRLPANIKLVSGMLYNEIDANNIPCTFFFSPKMFRNNLGIYWENRVHNAIKSVDSSEALAVREMTIIHSRDQEDEQKRHVQRKEMNEDGLKTDLAEKGNKDPRSQFYLAQHHYEMKEIDNAVSTYKQYLEVSTFPEERYQACLALSEILINNDKIEEGLLYAKQAEEECIDRIEHLILQADIYMRIFQAGKTPIEKIRALKAAEVKARTACELTVPDLETWNFNVPINPHFMQGQIYSWRPWWILAQIYDINGLKKKALDCVQRVLQWCPNDQNILKIRNDLVKMTGKGKPRVAVFDKTGQFTPAMVGALSSDYEFTTSPIYSVPNADICFLEWADDNAVAASVNPPGCPTVLRIHRYEVFTEYIHKINYHNIHHIIFETEHIKAEFLKRIKLPVRQGPQVHIIPNGVDLKRFKFKERKPGKNVAVVNFLTWKKGVDEMLRIAAAHPSYTFHVAGTWQSEDLKAFCDNFIEQNRIENVKFYGWVNDTNEWLDEVDANYFLNTSLHEGLPYAVLEAMAKGICPVVRNWPGAQTVLPSGCRYADMAMIETGSGFKAYMFPEHFQSKDMRKVLKDRGYTLTAQMNATKKVFQSCLKN